MELGIIGFGQLGQFAAKHLKEYFKVFAADKFDKRKEAKEIGISFVSIEEAASKDIVIVSVPISQFENSFREIKDCFKKGALVLDVCSVKVKPAKIMEELAPTNVEIIATHPLFGPQSGASGIKGLKIVVCPIRTKRAEKVKRFLEKLGLKVIVTTPEEHDKQMAKTQILGQFIARALINMDIQEQEITVPSFGKLFELKNMLKEDSIELFKDIQKNNPFAEEIREEFFKEIEKVKSNLEKDNK